MADTTRRVLCRTCKQEISIYDAKPYFTGKRTQYECIKCAKKGNEEAQHHVAVVVHKFKKEKKQ